MHFSSCIDYYTYATTYKMDNQFNLCSCCCSLIMLIGISVAIFWWDVNVIQDWSEDKRGLDYLGQVWLLATCLMVNYLWFSLPVIIFLRRFDCMTALRRMGWSLFIIFGPNLMLWNVIGCVCDTIQYNGYSDENAIIIILRRLHGAFSMESLLSTA